MRLDPDCVRDVLLALENHLKLKSGDHVATFTCGTAGYQIRVLEPNLQTYSQFDIDYSILQLAESGYVRANVSVDYQKEHVYVSKVLYLTPAGHDLAAKIRDKDSWSKKIKPVFKNFGSISLSIIESVAKHVAESIISSV